MRCTHAHARRTRVHALRGRQRSHSRGRVQRRIEAEDIVINIGKHATAPAPPPGHKWKAVIHNQYVSWLAGWKDSINTKDWKCVPRCRTAVLE